MKIKIKEDFKKFFEDAMSTYAKYGASIIVKVSGKGIDIVSDSNGGAILKTSTIELDEEVGDEVYFKVYGDSIKSLSKYDYFDLKGTNLIGRLGGAKITIPVITDDSLAKDVFIENNITSIDSAPTALDFVKGSKVENFIELDKNPSSYISLKDNHAIIYKPYGYIISTALDKPFSPEPIFLETLLKKVFETSKSYTTIEKAEWYKDESKIWLIVGDGNGNSISIITHDAQDTGNISVVEYDEDFKPLCPVDGQSIEIPAEDFFKKFLDLKSMVQTKDDIKIAFSKDNQFLKIKFNDINDVVMDLSSSEANDDIEFDDYSINFDIDVIKGFMSTVSNIKFVRDNDESHCVLLDAGEYEILLPKEL